MVCVCGVISSFYAANRSECLLDQVHFEIPNLMSSEPSVDLTHLFA